MNAVVSNSGPIPSTARVSPVVPRLEQGDCLTRDEFERRYECMPSLKKAELIEGMVYIPSPPRIKQHAGPQADLVGWLGFYHAYSAGLCVVDNATIRLDLDHELQPDGAMIVLPEYGGSVRFSDDDFIVGAPELIAEVAVSTVSIELHTKFRVYRRQGVREYIVWRVQDQAIDWFALQAGQFERLAADADGVIRSLVFPGLWLDAAAMVCGEMVAVLKTLQRGLDSPEHAEFVARLQARAPR